MNKQMIFNLVLRDFRVYRLQIIGWSLFGLTLGMFTIFINTNLSRMFISGATSFIIISIIVPFIPELTNNRVWTHTVSLPVTRKAIVVARFLTSLLIGTVNLFIWVIAFYAVKQILNSDPQYILGINGIIIVWMNILFGLALFNFAFYRFNLVITMGFYLFSVFLPVVLQTILFRKSNFALEEFIPSPELILMILSLFLISFYSSISYFERKDL